MPSTYFGVHAHVKNDNKDKYIYHMPPTSMLAKRITKELKEKELAGHRLELRVKGLLVMAIAEGQCASEA